MVARHVNSQHRAPLMPPTTTSSSSIPKLQAVPCKCAVTIINLPVVPPPDTWVQALHRKTCLLPSPWLLACGVVPRS